MKYVKVIVHVMVLLGATSLLGGEEQKFLVAQQFSDMVTIDKNFNIFITLPWKSNGGSGKVRLKAYAERDIQGLRKDRANTSNLRNYAVATMCYLCCCGDLAYVHNFVLCGGAGAMYTHCCIKAARIDNTQLYELPVAFREGAKERFGIVGVSAVDVFDAGIKIEPMYLNLGQQLNMQQLLRGKPATTGEKME